MIALNCLKGDLSSLKKEDMRSLEGEQDKDEDSCMGATSSTNTKRLPVDLSSVRRAYMALFKLPSSIFESALVNALVTLAGYLQMDLQTITDSSAIDDIVRVLLIVFEIPALGMHLFVFRTVSVLICVSRTDFRIWGFSRDCFSRNLQSDHKVVHRNSGRIGAYVGWSW